MSSVSLAPAASKIGLIHATLVAVQPMVVAFREQSPTTSLLHFLDEGLLPLVEKEGLTTHAISEIERLIDRAVASGVEGILLTCSAYSPTVPYLQARCPVPLLSSDEAMLAAAVLQGYRIGVIATVAAAGPTTATLLQQRAAISDRAVNVEVCFVPGAFDALKAGNSAEHDRLVRDGISKMAGSCDVVVLAQISMARALQGIPPFEKPVLTSPSASVTALLQRIGRTPPNLP